MTVTVPSDQQLRRILGRGVAEIIVEDEFVRLLKSGRSLRLKQGFDPSAPDIHLGHVVGLRKLRQLQELGHTVVLIVGDWTAQIGDPSGRSATRPMLTAAEVAANAESYLQQFFKIVDRSRTEVRRQTEWFDAFTLADVIKLTSRFTVAQILRRDDFAKRYAEERPIAITELLYPLLQAYDSVMVQADVEFGGTDQRFNNLLGRELQQMVGQRPQQVFLVPLLVGTDGAQKMSKSLGNYIGVAEPPEQIFGKAMSIPDTLIHTYFELLTDVTDEELAEVARQASTHAVNPMDSKKRLGRELVTQLYDAPQAAKAQQHFERVFQNKEMPEDIDQYTVVDFNFQNPRDGRNADLIVEEVGSTTLRVNIVRLLAKHGLAASSSEARRLLSQGSLRITDRQRTQEQQLRDEDIVVDVTPQTVIRVGKRQFAMIRDTR